MKNIMITGPVGITFSVMWMAVNLWFLDVVGIERWTASRIGNYIGMVLEYI